MVALTDVHRLLSLFVVGVLVGLDGVHANSRRPAPLHARAVVHPRDLSVRVLPRHDRDTAKLKRRSAITGFDGLVADRAKFDAAKDDDGTAPRWHDRWLLSFTAHDTPLTLSLKPTKSLVHPNGIKLVGTHTNPDGSRTTTERRLERADVRAYEGVVLDNSQDEQEWVKGEIAGLERDPADRDWARISILSDSLESLSDEVQVSGTFTYRGDVYSIEPTTRYLAAREALDPEPPVLAKRGMVDSNENSNFVVVRQTDILTHEEQVAELVKRGLPVSHLAEPAQCGHDDLSFNIDPMHPVLQAAADPAMLDVSPWSSTFFGLPVRPAIPSRFTGSSDQSNRFGTSFGYPPAHKVIKRQGGGDIITGGDANASSNFINNIGNTAGCPKSPRVVFVGVAADCTYTNRYNGQTGAREQILNDFNQANALYQRSFNMSLGIIELNVQSGSCPTTSSQVDQSNPWNVGCQEGGGPGVSLNDRLSIFSQWRGDKGGSDGAGLWHLMTNCSTGTEVGVAWLGQVCRVTSSYSQGQTSSGTGVTSVTRNEWQVVAHEIGHNFGAIHDCASGCSLQSSNCCPLSASTCNAQAQYIMSPVSSRDNVTSFSPCSIGNVCYTISNSLNTTCFATPGEERNPPIISIESCGNGIVEGDEQCDPGSQNDPCCDASTCRFINGATCSPLNSLCCTSQCQVASSGTVCRPSIDASCDREEICNGSSAECPDDEFEDDGKSCGDNGRRCASGVCTSRDLQCQNAGSSLGLTRACSVNVNSGCSITCQDPSSALSCVVLDQSFRDGTSCGYGGRCRNAECQSGSALETAKSWYTNNLRISIPVTVVVGIIVLLLLFAIIRCIFCRNRPMRPKKRMGKAASANYYNGAPPSQAYNNGYGNGYGGGQPHAYPPASNGYAPPPGPPPSHPSGRGSVMRNGPPNYANGNGHWVDPGQYNGPNYR